MDALNPSPPHASAPTTSRSHSTLFVVFMLLLAICLGSLGSFSLAPYLLPDLSISSPAPAPTTTTAPSTPQSTATTVLALNPTATPFSGAFIESECTATPQTMKYLSPTQGQATPQATPTALSSEWALAKRTEKDLANAQACAASFVIAYETFDAAHVKTFEDSTSMLTDGAKGRFYGRPKGLPDQHVDPMWQANLQKQHYRQAAQVGLPGLLATTLVSGKLLVWMVVPYQNSFQSDNGVPMIQNTRMTVLLVAVPINVQQTGTGWQVSQWLSGGDQFQPPD